MGSPGPGGHYPRGGQALRGPFGRFGPGDAVAWFARHGLELVEEADGRLFPRSNRSESVVASLRRAALQAGVRLHTGVGLQGAALASGGGFALELRGGQCPQMTAGRLVLATGSHPSGRRLAASLGHGLVPPVPSLFTLAMAGNPLLELAGVVMDPVELALQLPPDPAGGAGGSRFRQRGVVLITHWGISGPATLRLTALQPGPSRLPATAANYGSIGPVASPSQSWRPCLPKPSSARPNANWPTGGLGRS